MKNLLEIGNAHNILNHNGQAIGAYLAILAINPTMYAALYNIGYTLKKEGYYEQAITIYKKVLDAKPDYALAHCGLAAALLATGDFEQGFQEYEWRWKTCQEKRKKFTQPVWNGSSLAKKRLYVYAEQGLGDTIQFIRYLPELKKQGATIIFETQPPLRDLLSLCPYIDHLITASDPEPVFDYHVPLMSIPLIVKTRLETIPCTTPYLYASPELTTAWREKLAADHSFKIGICWHGNSRYTRPALQIAAQEKAIPLSAFAPLAALPDVSLYSLQRVDGIDELDSIDFTVNTFDAAFDHTQGRFMDTAAVMHSLDLVITSDTSIAHLAGALGIPTWLLLSHPADWRWLRDRTDSPWYPTIRIFRQEKHNDWHAVIQAVRKALTKLVAARKY